MLANSLYNANPALLCNSHTTWAVVKLNYNSGVFLPSPGNPRGQRQSGG